MSAVVNETENERDSKCYKKNYAQLNIISFPKVVMI